MKMPKNVASEFISDKQNCSVGVYLRHLTVSCILLFSIFCLINPKLHAEGTVANTVIQNGGDAGTTNIADTAGDTIVQWVIGTSTSYATCSQIGVTVSTGYGIAELPAPTDQTLAPGSTAYFAYTAYNIGNATDTFTLSVTTYAGQGWSVKIYKDNNKDGIHQDNEEEVTSTDPLVQDTTFYFFVAVFIPSDATDGTSTYVRLEVRDQNGSGTEDNWPVAGNDVRIDSTTAICSAVTLQMVKDSNRTTARPFTDEIVFTSTITAVGSVEAKNVIYKDKLPSECEYVSGSMVRCIWSTGGNREQLTDDSGDDEGTWDSGQQFITINLGDLQAGTSAYVEFKVRVK